MVATFTESDEFDIEKSTIITVTSASYALNNYYNFMLDSFNSADFESNEPVIQLKDDIEEDYEEGYEEKESTEEVSALFKQYISILANNEDDPIEELSEEQFDSMPCSETKH